ncbi:MAG: phenylacetic acid degradation bifunctional protein PaaZ, partial [Gammaproteobacteria bacterium]|nr:phenylacetic acid degradation bifunctional protein PaaZ [Gammaproteobacteria bacterium]
MRLESYAAGAWRLGSGGGTALRDATTGEVITHAGAEGLDTRAMLDWARDVGGPNLRRLTFHERAAMLKALARDLTGHKDEYYPVSFATGATRGDSWIDIDGGISTLFVYASKGTRELPNGRVFIDGAVEALSKTGTFVGQHLCVPLEGAAVHINAFNFPVWGMLEKLAPALLAGVPAIVKPATQTCYLAERVFRRILESGILPEGAVQLICGGVGDLFDHLTCQDVVSFTGSAATALKLRQHPVVTAHSVRFTAETDSLNSSILGPDAGAGSPELELFVREVVREMTVKAGQKCTAIRKALVPEARAADVIDALRAALARVVVGDPRLESVKMGPVASLAQRREVSEQLGRLRQEAQVLVGADAPAPLGADAERGAFMAPTLLYCRDASRARAVHSVEAFGPVCTLLPYRDPAEAIALARRGGGSLAGSVFTADEALAAQLVLGLAPYHGRIVVVNRHC